MSPRVTAARYFRCRLRLGRERFAVQFPTSDDTQGEALLCGGCIDQLKVFLKGPPT